MEKKEERIKGGRGGGRGCGCCERIRAKKREVLL